MWSMAKGLCETQDTQNCMQEKEKEAAINTGLRNQDFNLGVVLIWFGFILKEMKRFVEENRDKNNYLPRMNCPESC